VSERVAEAECNDDLIIRPRAGAATTHARMAQPKQPPTRGGLGGPFSPEG